MIIEQASQFHVFLLWVNTLNQEKALVGASSVIVKTSPMVRLQLYKSPVRVRR